MTGDITANDQRKRRCPMLGHELTFAYCRAPGRQLPCSKIFDCWWEAFDVQAFIREHYTEQQIAEIMAPRPEKVSSLLDLIRQARERARPKDPTP